MPLSTNKKHQSRQSLALFVNADSFHVVKCLDDSDKYPPIKCVDYIYNRFTEKLVPGNTNDSIM